MSKDKTPNITGRTGPKPARRGGVARPLGPIVGALSKRAFGRRGFASGEIIAEWARVVGDNLARLSAPERITYPQGKRSGGTLHLRIESGSIAVELQHLEPVLLERINAYFGYKAVERVRLIQAPIVQTGKPGRWGQWGQPGQSRRAPPDPDPKRLAEITQSLTDVEDTDLKQSLEKLAKAIVGRNSRRTDR